MFARAAQGFLVPWHEASLKLSGVASLLALGGSFLVPWHEASLNLAFVVGFANRRRVSSCFGTRPH